VEEDGRKQKKEGGTTQYTNQNRGNRNDYAAERAGDSLTRPRLWGRMAGKLLAEKGGSAARDGGVHRHNRGRRRTRFSWGAKLGVGKKQRGTWIYYV